ncbi:MAG: hypothetical protein V5A18_09065 [Haloarculaceae archaeon]
MGFGDDYRYSIDDSNDETRQIDLFLEGEWHRGNFHLNTNYQDASLDIWRVVGRSYVATPEYCTAVPLADADPLRQVDADQRADTSRTREQVASWKVLQAAGRTTVDGEATRVFEVAACERGNEWPVSYYVGAVSRFIGRLETGGIVVEYWDWGNVGPIDAPC